MLSSKSGMVSELTFIGTLFSYVFSLAMGVFLGYILQRMLEIGAAIMGAIGGVFLALFINQVVFVWVDGEASQIISWTLSILLGGYFAYLSKVQLDNIVMISTAILGSYCTVRGISLFFPKTFPPETEILDKIAASTIDPLFITYILAILACSAASFLYQKRQLFLER